MILLDEIEKPHPDVFNVLLQILEDGCLTDNKDRTGFFHNTVVMMTSNAGAHLSSPNRKRCATAGKRFRSGYWKS